MVHQVIGKLRAGQVGERSSKGVLVGHSLGSAISLIESSLFDDVDALVFTGTLHHIGADTCAQFIAWEIRVLISVLVIARLRTSWSFHSDQRTAQKWQLPMA